MQIRKIFDLPKKPEQLDSANAGLANAGYRQISATKDVTGHQFAHGTQQFRFDTSGNTWFLPSMCYFRLRCSLSQVREDGGPPLPVLSNGDLAPNMGLASNLFKSVEVQLNGQSLERIAGSLPQIDALKTRMQNTRGWLDALGQTTNFWDQSFATRQAAVAVDGHETSKGTAHPRPGPVLSQVKAGFHANHRISYSKATSILAFDANHAGDIDIERGPMALRAGDRVLHGVLPWRFGTSWTPRTPWPTL